MDNELDIELQKVEGTDDYVTIMRTPEKLYVKPSRFSDERFVFIENAS